MSWWNSCSAIHCIHYPLEKFKTQITNPPKSMSCSWSGNRRLETFPAMSGLDKIESKFLNINIYLVVNYDIHLNYDNNAHK